MSEQPAWTDADVNWRDWHIEGNRRGDGWVVRATHLPTGQSWLSLQAHSFEAGRRECIEALMPKPVADLRFEQHKARIEAHAKLLASQMAEALDLPSGVRFEYGPASDLADTP